MPNIDLHMHSVYSDGTYTPSELVAFAKHKGLSALSLTDHDTIDGLEEAQLYCRKERIEFINGIEINSFFILNSKRVNIHVLGYVFSPEALQPYIEQLKKLRHEHNDAIQKALAKYLRKGGSAFVEYNTHPFSTVANMIHEAGGIVSLAHPAEYGIYANADGHCKKETPFCHRRKRFPRS